MFPNELNGFLGGFPPVLECFSHLFAHWCFLGWFFRFFGYVVFRKVRMAWVEVYSGPSAFGFGLGVSEIFKFI